VRSQVRFEETEQGGRGAGPAPGSPSREARDRQLAELIEAMARGESQALATLYEAALGRVYGLALRIVRTREAAEEVAIDVFVQAWRTAATYDALRGAPLTWLLTICRSRALDYLRRAEPADPHPDPESLAAADPLARSTDPQDLLLACEGEARLKRALESLTALQRQLIALAFFRGLTHQEIAAHARLPLGSVKTYIRRALAQLRAELGTVH
jgi:RNA polymerase sigma-70 factor (ECF subfamily)